MKLFVKKDIKAGETYPKNTFVAYGKTLSENDKDGWFVKVEFPFTQNLLHIDPDTFDQNIGPCRFMIRFRYRPANDHRIAIKHVIRGWFPV